MDEENSNDVVLVENTDGVEDFRPSSTSTEKRPLMLLFERLISNDTKSNTVLTNAQILSILEKEFNIDIKTLHDLEIDIHINIVKKFLKDWPLWDAFDRVMNRLKKKEAVSEINTILEQKYAHLKEYLGTMIETAKPTASEAVNKLKTGSMETSEETSNDTVLEIFCTRRMLNNFIYNQPNPAENNSVFNLIDFEHYKLNPALPSLSFASLLHWYGVRLSIELPFLQLTRYTVHRLAHTLVNNLNGIQTNTKKELDMSVHMKASKSITNSVMINGIKVLLDKILLQYKDKIEYNMLEQIFNVIKSDLTIDSKTIEVPGSYKQHLSKYPYVRKLFTKIDVDEPPQYNLFIEESITPIQDWHIGKFIYVVRPTLPLLQSWLKFECAECKQKFNGVEFLTFLRDHFKVYHQDEPDWTCTNCEKVFSMADLTNQGWRHDC